MVGGLLYDAGSEVGWWLHNTTVLVFLCVLPLSKHFHIITAIPNVFFGKLPPRERRAAAGDHASCPPRRSPRSSVPPEGLVGVASLDDLSWKQVLDAFACTECGRCTAVCPATAAGSPLAPRQLILDLRDALYHGDGRVRPLIPDDVAVVVHDLHGVRRGLPGRDRARADDRRPAPQPRRQGRHGPAAAADAAELRRPGQLLGQVGAHARPLDQGTRLQDPGRAQGARRSTCGSSATSRPSTSARSSPRSPSRAMLHDAGVSFGLLYEGERNSGNDVRRVGEEGLFELLVEQNLGALGEAPSSTRSSPPTRTRSTRCATSIREFGLDKPVYHYTELLADLVARGVISLQTPLTGTRVTYHDPCYLARYNRITEAPRRADRGDRAPSWSRCRATASNTFCCGAGGGRMWMMDDPDDRASGRASSGSARRRRSATSTTSSSPAPRTWRCTPTRSRSSAPTSRSPT